MIFSRNKIDLQKLSLVLFLFFGLAKISYAQQYSLYNSRTLYDSFENPSQRAYQVDTSRRFAFNFLIPTISLNGTFSGPAEPAFKSLIYDGVFNGRDITLGENRMNTINLSSNNYIAMLRVLKSVKKYKEMGISWQIRNDGRVRVTNEVFAIFDDYRVFNANNLSNLFNVNGYNQSYHQFSFAYRQNYTKRFSLGAKFSLLSGISYTALKVDKSEINMNEANDEFDVSVRGKLRSSFKFDDFKREMLKPNFKNVGLSITAGASYHLRDGWTILGNLKDIGFIRWNKEAYEYDFDTGKIIIDNASNNNADERLADSLDTQISAKSVNKSYVSMVNGKAELMLSKEFGNYKPNLILSKTIYYGGGDLVLVNNYHIKNHVLTASAAYNTTGIVQIGGQYMIKTPNVEFYMGSDQLLKSYEMIRNYSKTASPYTSGYTGVSFYLGFGLKFGSILEHQANATNISGFRKNPIGKFIKGLVGKKD
ncbi:MAG: DUF5723 family protein [Daejeonella sp.]|uniref:DUF5723 family protein n=1 Tax=Daejeonella sp. TaxID=2805397 RepID=UPI0027361DAD|nr:DUF5723 family protein [Daejeonella sp.]MDP3467228.1 DUF5723 family protein [Daejeonella sp.]